MGNGNPSPLSLGTIQILNPNLVMHYHPGKLPRIPTLAIRFWIQKREWPFPFPVGRPGGSPSTPAREARRENFAIWVYPQTRNPYENDPARESRRCPDTNHQKRECGSGNGQWISSGIGCAIHQSDLTIPFILQGNVLFYSK